MTRGHPDWWVNTQQDSFLDVDTAEAAVRLGSPDVYSRSGRVLYIDGFEASIAAWEEATAAATAVISRDTTYAFHGQACLKILPATAGAGQGGVIKRFPYVLAGKHSVELAFWAYDGVDKLDVQLGFVRDLGMVIYDIRIDFDAKKLYYETTGAVWTEFGTFPTNLRNHHPDWHWLKLYVDPVEKKYVLFRLDEVEFDLSAYDPYSAVTSIADATRVQVICTDTAFGAAPLYVDNLILAMDEP